MQAYDAIVLGVGGIGSAALMALARRGARVVGLDRFPPGHDRGSSHGQTRMIRQAYFEHPDYVPLVLSAYERWHDLCARRRAALFQETGLLEVGPPDGAVVTGVLRSAKRHGLEVDRLAGPEIMRRWPGFRLAEGLSGVFERRAGLLRVEECVRAQVDEALLAGAELRCGEAALRWEPNGDGVTVTTDRDTYNAGRLIVTAGPWAEALLGAVPGPLEVRRKPQYWFAAGSPVYQIERGFPAFLFETARGVYYGFPQIDERGVKLARHDGGAAVTDPLTLDRQIDPLERASVDAFRAEFLPEVTATCLHHAVCMYTMSRDEHFVVDRHPEYPQVSFAAGLSGHGFKFSPVLGEALAALALDATTDGALDFLRLGRASLRGG